MAKTVRLYPVPGAYIPGVPTAVIDVSAEEAERLLAYQPPAFTTDPPPEVPAAEQPESPSTEDGLIDSQEE